MKGNKEKLQVVSNEFWIDAEKELPPIEKSCYLYVIETDPKKEPIGQIYTGFLGESNRKGLQGKILHEEFWCINIIFNQYRTWTIQNDNPDETRKVTHWALMNIEAPIKTEVH